MQFWYWRQNNPNDYFASNPKIALTQTLTLTRSFSLTEANCYFAPRGKIDPSNFDICENAIPNIDFLILNTPRPLILCRNKKCVNCCSQPTASQLNWNDHYFYKNNRETNLAVSNLNNRVHCKIYQ